MSQVAEVEWKGRTGPFALQVAPGVFSPTHTSRTLADALEISADDTVIDVGCGDGRILITAVQKFKARAVGIEIDPKNQPCRVNYGLMLARHGRIEEATTQLSAALSPAQVHYNLASVYEQQGKKDQAKSEYIEAIKSDPKLIDAQMRLAGLDKN